jgi:perosamine synthetase
MRSRQAAAGYELANKIFWSSGAVSIQRAFLEPTQGRVRAAQFFFFFFFCLEPLPARRCGLLWQSETRDFVNDDLTPLAPTWPLPDEQIAAALQAAVADGSWGRYEGPHGQALCERLQQFHDLPLAYLCSSGTFAVELALRGLGVEPGDEVILAAYDFPGNFRGVEAVGARPVLVDIERSTGCLDVDQFLEACGPAVRAVIVSHLHGGLADMQRLCGLAEERHIAVVEDACQATAATVQGRRAGAWGDVGVLSFGGSKLLTAGRGGALLTRRPDVVQRAKVFCERGNHAFPLSELQAAVLSPQLDKLPPRHQQRLANAHRLRSAIADLAVLEPLADAGRGEPSYYKMAWYYEDPRPGGRDALIQAARARGLDVGAGFRGFFRRSAKRCRSVGTLSNSRSAAETILLLHHPILLADAPAREQAAESLRQAVAAVAPHERA